MHHGNGKEAPFMTFFALKIHLRVLLWQCSKIAGNSNINNSYTRIIG